MQHCSNSSEKPTSRSKNSVLCDMLLKRSQVPPVAMHFFTMFSAAVIAPGSRCPPWLAQSTEKGRNVPFFLSTFLQELLRALCKLTPSPFESRPTDDETLPSHRGSFCSLGPSLQMRPARTSDLIWSACPGPCPESTHQIERLRSQFSMESILTKSTSLVPSC